MVPSLARSGKKSWRATPVCLLWKQWMESNRKVFEDLEKTKQTIKLSFMNTLLEWVKLYVDDYPMSMIGLVDWITSE